VRDREKPRRVRLFTGGNPAKPDCPGAADVGTENESLFSSPKEAAMTAYYDHDQLRAFRQKIAEGNPELADKFFAYSHAVFADGALTAKEKALIALAVAHAVLCPYCIETYTRSSQKLGATLEQMTEALHVAAEVRAGSALTHGMIMLDSIRK
jgi:4-carboxymuconolactone decarboxylase